MSLNLDVPADIAADQQYSEVLRVRIADDAVITMRDVFGTEVHNWGMVLADVAVHITRMKQQNEGLSFEETLAMVENGYRGRMTEQHDLQHRSLTGWN